MLPVIRKPRRAIRWASVVALCALGGGAWAANLGAPGHLAELDGAMDRMMAAMKPTGTGDADADFVAMMRPHHQGAIDMAVTELRYGRNPQLRRIAQEIIIEQQQEIAAMDRAVGAPPPPSSPAPTQQPFVADHHH